MARPLRIEYPDAWYHVMNRGRRGEDIFSDDQDYMMFTELLKGTTVCIPSVTTAATNVMVSFSGGATNLFSLTRTATCCRRFDISIGIP